MVTATLRKRERSAAETARPRRSRCDCDRGGSVFEFGDQTKQITMQLAAVATRDPCDARSIERLDDGIRGRNRL
jgi:hypothetical protein